MRKTSVIILAALCLTLLGAITAAAFGEIRYPDRPLNLRADRSAQARWVGSLHPGQKVRVAFMKDGWVAVFEPGETRADESAAVGFSNARYLLPKATRVEPDTWGELVYTPRKLNIRDSSSISGKVVGSLEAMQRVKVDFPEGDWVMVFRENATIRSQMNALGYSAAKYFEPVTTQVSDPQAAAPADEAGTSGVAEVRAMAVTPPAVQPPPVAQPAVAAPAPTEDVVAVKDASGDWGKVVTLQRDISLWRERTSGSTEVRALKAGDRVRVDFLKSGWYAVFEENEVLRSENRALGYALRALVDGDGSDAAAPPAGPAPAQPQPPAIAEGAPRQTVTIDRSRFSGARRPDPTPDKNAHGYQYRLLEKSETKKYGVTWISIKVFLGTTKLPDANQLKDFSTTLWNEHRRAMRNLVVHIYLPGMDIDDLAYGVVSFDDKAMLELWVRQVTLFGTKFL
ncbi:SH3 domain-containing protein [Pseudodesulfovibrio sp. F-1]|uniref:SH3 domain-containing protein n=1 Tax=Pseudodesulfovibrio alkaliphilus TaxID=2661613 RepID=A0A7K1KLU6_9BACT|nr:SH3 domain-containing protein [Pseudodesulfovibrio alkaliphilus]MUM76872.1 SH3 domain-containing protein [Pseudodesulfovibrio alkaliphilus]